MKEQILKIAKDLEQGTITDTEAQTLLFGLFGVSGTLTDELLDKEVGIEEKRLNKGLNYYIDRSYQMSIYRRGIIRGVEIISYR
jgi:hypothetical protein